MAQAGGAAARRLLALARGRHVREVLLVAEDASRQALAALLRLLGDLAAAGADSDGVPAGVFVDGAATDSAPELSVADLVRARSSGGPISVAWASAAQAAALRVLLASPAVRRGQAPARAATLVEAYAAGVAGAAEGASHFLLLEQSWDPRRAGAGAGGLPGAMLAACGAERLGACGCKLLAANATRVMAAGAAVDVDPEGRVTAVPLLAGLSPTDARAAAPRDVPLLFPECVLMPAAAWRSVGGPALEQQQVEREGWRPAETGAQLSQYIAAGTVVTAAVSQLHEHALLGGAIGGAPTAHGRRRWHVPLLGGLIKLEGLNEALRRAQDVRGQLESLTPGLVEIAPDSVPAELAAQLKGLDAIVREAGSAAERLDAAQQRVARERDAALSGEGDNAASGLPGASRSHVAAAGGMLYSTLSDVPVDSDLSICQDRWEHLPPGGWRLAEDNDPGLHEAASSHTWSCQGVVTASGTAWRTAARSPAGGPGRVLRRGQLQRDGSAGGGMRVASCDLQVLIARPGAGAPPPTAPPASGAQLRELREQLRQLAERGTAALRELAVAVERRLTELAQALLGRTAAELAAGARELEVWFDMLLRLRAAGRPSVVAGGPAAAAEHAPAPGRADASALRREELARLPRGESPELRIAGGGPELWVVTAASGVEFDTRRRAAPLEPPPPNTLDIALRYLPLESDVRLLGPVFAASWGWGPELAAALSAPMRVVWSAWCCRCCGFSAEMVHFFYPLRRALGQGISTVNHQDCFCAGLPEAAVGAIRRMHVSAPRLLWPGRSQLNASDSVVWVSHIDPLGYAMHIPAGARPDYFIGRSMYEFTSIDIDWAHAANDYRVDEVWVPSTWVRDVFALSGVSRGKLRVIPEAVDTDFWSPDAAAPLPVLPPPHWRYRQLGAAAARQGGHYKFLSAFKWELRKGWDVLLEAFTAAFGPSDKVCLYISTHMWYPGHPSTWGPTHDPNLMARAALNHTRKLGIADAALPCIVILSEELGESEVARLYRSADAFVLPTRGEGWGLPCQQAMAMGLPAIGTRWGGSTDFMLDSNSFLIDVNGTAPIPRDGPYHYAPDKRWAQPSVTHLRDLLRRVAADPARAAAVGAEARRHLVARFSEEAVAGAVERELGRVERLLRRRKRRAAAAAAAAPS